MGVLERISYLEGLESKGVISKFLHPGNNPGEAAYHIEILNTGGSEQSSGSLEPLKPPAPSGPFIPIPFMPKNDDNQAVPGKYKDKIIDSPLKIKGPINSSSSTPNPIA